MIQGKTTSSPLRLFYPRFLPPSHKTATNRLPGFLPVPFPWNSRPLLWFCLPPPNTSTIPAPFPHPIFSHITPEYNSPRTAVTLLPYFDRATDDIPHSSGPSHTPNPSHVTARDASSRGLSEYSIA
ncbi:hypothetical protein EJ06DRAFT_530790 [Trichodelitschia bisporula]|uniref:Uncharacterized protein n=1 Tax=Trichodelitschia bisporula TaxID=703511 RepID=A0A6G1HVH5_9PEZI|nr:hypothetical protein EJ06DRAFT_530790 [Trichodelitschia bisporula]